MAIKDWPELTRPKEKALLYGITSLSDEEVLAIILNNGIKNYSSLDIAKILLKDGLRNLARMNYESLIEVPGISKHRALLLSSIFELLVRYERSKVIKNTIYKNPLDVIEHLMFSYSLESEEKMMLILIDSKGYIKKEIVLSKGSHSSIEINVQEIFKHVLKNNCERFILIHNHPDGDVNPSKQDIKTTHVIKEKAKLLSLKLLDHIIISNDEYYSFLNNCII